MGNKSNAQVAENPCVSRRPGPAEPRKTPAVCRIELCEDEMSLRAAAGSATPAVPPRGSTAPNAIPIAASSPQPHQLMQQIDDAFQLRAKLFFYPAVLRLYLRFRLFPLKQNCKISARLTPKPCNAFAQKSNQLTINASLFPFFNGRLFTLCDPRACHCRCKDSPRNGLARELGAHEIPLQSCVLVFRKKHSCSNDFSDLYSLLMLRLVRFAAVSAADRRNLL
jgi:hypothetical protein